ncbi:hypothetical protein [Nevskia ramosa]|uniref:hypothetical protein n=1 Tax=Nevskia ramosa TaxID=64002 RepID=UPI0023523479|nr:hypothetical protein [Nevskia ramosa]
MSATAVPSSAAEPKAVASPPKTGFAQQPGYLFGPWMDFFCLGGATLLIIPWFALLPTDWKAYGDVLIITTAVAHFINNPHFAHSYHLFYRDFGKRGFNAEYPREWRVRYLIAGVAVPLLLIGFFLWCLVTKNARALGFSVNLMFFTVGWHYVKQGYGMLMLDSVLKRRFFNEREKKVLLWNAYVVWFLSWLLANAIAYKADYWGISYYTFATPQPILTAIEVIAGLSSAAVLLMLGLKWRATRQVPPFNGLVAYTVALYLWLLYRDPVLTLIFPAMHSIQYMVVVWRYELNVQQDRSTDAKLPTMTFGLRMALFYAIAMGLGYLGFWMGPQWLAKVFPTMLEGVGSGAFLLAAWIFINVHHYFLDSVVWRKGNPETGKYLFR